jgi:hypothetical protein
MHFTIATHAFLCEVLSGFSNGDDGMKQMMLWMFVAVLLAGWQSALAQERFVPSTAIKFSHKDHVDAAELECELCHDVSKSTSARDRLLPAKAICAECHEVADQDECAFCHTDMSQLGKIQSVGSEILFAHKDHLTYDGVDCATCHAGVEKSVKTGGSHLPNMPTCSTCHNDAQAPKACAACHTDLSNLRPESHVMGWTKGHGRRVRLGDMSCLPCHSEPDCQECHEGAKLTIAVPPLGSQATFAPQSSGQAGLILKNVHELNFRFTHALEAKGKTKDCAKCHEQDTFCADCHQADVGFVKPAWHGGADWGAIAGAVGTGGGRHATLARRDMNRCASCHAAVGDDPTCVLCHMDRTPGLGNDPKTHGPRFKSQVGEGDFHNNPNSLCFNCHTFTGPAGGAGFCGYCHGPQN